MSDERKGMSGRDSLVVVGTLIVLALASWFVFPGNLDLARIAGLIAGFLVAIFGPFRQRMPIVVALGLAVMFALFGWLLRHMIGSETATVDLGASAGAVAATSVAVSSMFYGLAAAVVALAVVRRPAA